MIKRNSLITEMLIISLIATTIVVFSITTISVLNSNKTIKDQYLNTSKNACEMINTVVEDFSEEINFITEQMASDNQLINALESQDTLKLESLLININSNLDESENIFISKIEDNSYFKILVDANNIARDFSFGKKGEAYSENLQAALSNQTRTSYPSQSPISKRTVLLSTTPIRLSNGDKYAMCYARHLDAKLQNIIKNFKIGTTGYAYIMKTSNGEMVVHPDSTVNWNLNAADLNLPPKTFNKNNRGDKAITYQYKGKEKTLLPYVNEELDYTVMGSFENGEIQNHALATIQLNVITSVIALIVLGIIIIRVFTLKLAPLGQSEQVLKKISEGNLTETIKIVKGENEISQLSRNLDKTTSKIRSLIAETSNSIAQVQLGSNELSKASVHINNGASSQAASVEEIATSIEEINATVEQNAQNALENMQMANTISNDMDILIKSNEESVKQANNMHNSLSNIAELSSRIKLLSLNAAIESSQAGDFGKGFGVIATEIRKLAEHSQTLNDQISEIGDDLLEKANNTQEICNRIVPLINKNSNSSNEIYAASNEQRSSMGQINTSINELNNIAQSNTSTSEELNASAEELNQQTEQLLKTISFFKTGNDNISIKKNIKPIKEVQPVIIDKAKAINPNQEKPKSKNNKNNKVELELHLSEEYETF